MGIMLEALRSMLGKASTRKYPKQKFKPYPKFRGRLIVNARECTGCGLCRMVCPTGAIRLKRKSKIMKVGKLEYRVIIHPINSIDIGRCMLCGLCVDICPPKVIEFTNDFELATKDKKKLIVK